MGLADGLVSNFYGDKIDAIKAADPKDESGYIKGIEEKQKFAKFQNDLNELGGKEDFGGALKMTEEALASGDFQGDNQQQIMIFKGIISMQLGKLDDALKALDEAKAYAPESEISKHIDSMKDRFVKAAEEKKAE
jgi:tetratricopeptide (TPR) repeat protein